MNMLKELARCEGKQVYYLDDDGELLSINLVKSSMWDEKEKRFRPLVKVAFTPWFTEYWRISPCA